MVRLELERALIRGQRLARLVESQQSAAQGHMRQGALAGELGSRAIAAQRILELAARRELVAGTQRFRVLAVDVFHVRSAWAAALSGASLTIGQLGLGG